MEAQCGSSETLGSTLQLDSTQCHSLVACESSCFLHVRPWPGDSGLAGQGLHPGSSPVRTLGCVFECGEVCACPLVYPQVGFQYSIACCL